MMLNQETKWGDSSSRHVRGSSGIKMDLTGPHHDTHDTRPTLTGQPRLEERRAGVLFVYVVGEEKEGEGGDEERQEEVARRGASHQVQPAAKERRECRPGAESNTRHDIHGTHTAHGTRHTTYAHQILSTSAVAKSWRSLKTGEAVHQKLATLSSYRPRPTGNSRSSTGRPQHRAMRDAFKREKKRKEGKGHCSCMYRGRRRWL